MIGRICMPAHLSLVPAARQSIHLSAGPQLDLSMYSDTVTRRERWQSLSMLLLQEKLWKFCKSGFYYFEVSGVFWRCACSKYGCGVETEVTVVEDSEASPPKPSELSSCFFSLFSILHYLNFVWCQTGRCSLVWQSRTLWDALLPTLHKHKVMALNYTQEN